MKHHKLRIAWSVAWGIVAVLLVALWVRSYEHEGRRDLQYMNANRRIYSVHSDHGLIELNATEVNADGKGWNIEYFGSDGMGILGGLGTHRGALSKCVRIPYWLVLLASVAATLAPWVARLRRFSLRTLLIATTLVAVGLGLIVWLPR